MEENISDALRMAGSVLLFILGLSITILALTQARETIDIVLSYSDKESLTIENDSRYYYLSDENDTSRYVGKETIIPAIYRAYKENYKIVFKFPDDHYLYTQYAKNQVTGVFEEKKIKTIDLSKQIIASDLASRQFLNGIIYGDFEYSPGKDKSAYVKNFNITPHDISLYSYLTEKENSYKIKETLGTYYMEELGSTPTELEDVNKTEKRVITYTFERNIKEEKYE